MAKQSWVYILTNKSRSTLYIGVTSNLDHRISQHRNGEYEGFSKHYNTFFLLYYEEFRNMRDAIAYEKKLKKWNRAWKERLINKENPEWKDLCADWI